jgi:hypothetical protein
MSYFSKIEAVHFSRNVGKHIFDYTALNPREEQSLFIANAVRKSGLISSCFYKDIIIYMALSIVCVKHL